MTVPKTWRALAVLPGLTPRHYGQGDQIPTWGAGSPSCQGNRSLLQERDVAPSFFLLFSLEGLQDWVSAPDLMKQDS